MEKNSVACIYSFQPEIETDNRYKITYFYDHAGFLDPQDLAQIYTQKFQKVSEALTFATYEELQDYISTVLTDASYEHCFAISVTDFNTAVENARDVNQLAEIPKKFGTLITAPETKTGGFLSKLKKLI